MKLPAALVPLATVLSPEEAMRGLVVPIKGAASTATVAWVQGLGLSPALEALAWLYLDELDRAHEVCQTMEGPTGAELHAIVHRREGDFWNAQYWYRRAGEGGGEGAKLTKSVEAGDRSEDAIERQRAEWERLAARVAA